MIRRRATLLIGIGMFLCLLPQPAQATTTLRCKRSGHSARDRYLMRSHTAVLAAEARKRQADDPTHLERRNAAVAERETARTEIMQLLSRVNDGRHLNTTIVSTPRGGQKVQIRDEASARALEAASKKLDGLRAQLMSDRISPAEARAQAASLAADVERALAPLREATGGARPAGAPHGGRTTQPRLPRTI